MNHQRLMTRRSALLGGITATAAAIPMGYSSAQQMAKAQHAQFQWRMISRWDEGFPDQFVAAQRLANRISAMSDGRLMIEVVLPNEVVPFSDTLNAVCDGTAEMCRSLAYRNAVVGSDDHNSPRYMVYPVVFACRCLLLINASTVGGP